MLGVCPQPGGGPSLGMNRRIRPAYISRNPHTSTDDSLLMLMQEGATRNSASTPRRSGSAMTREKPADAGRDGGAAPAAIHREVPKPGARAGVAGVHAGDQQRTALSGSFRTRYRGAAHVRRGEDADVHGAAVLTSGGRSCTLTIYTQGDDGESDERLAVIHELTDVVARRWRPEALVAQGSATVR